MLVSSLADADGRAHVIHEVQMERIAAAGLSDRFRHVEAPNGASKMAFFEEIDVFTVPARFIEPKGLYLLEAMACGLPSVVPSRGAFPEMILASGGGLLCEPEDPADLAIRLGELLEDPDKAAVLGQEGRDWVERCNSREAMAGATGEVFKRVLSGK
jgi:glycosyltransferase involved in cell wall biosynthesis